MEEPEYDQDHDFKYQIEYQRNEKLKKLLPSHHYVFVHEVIRQFCQTKPNVYFAKIATEQEKFVNLMWEITCEECGEADNDYFSPKDIEFHLVNINSYPTVITVMPYPLICTEAYIAAAVLIDNNKAMHSEFEHLVAFITLERAIGLYGIETYYLCAWNGSTHINLEVTLDSPDPNEFIEAVEYVLNEHMNKLLSEDEAKKWDDIHRLIGRSFVSAGVTGNA